MKTQHDAGLQVTLGLGFCELPEWVPTNKWKTASYYEVMQLHKYRLGQPSLSEAMGSNVSAHAMIKLG